MNLQEQINRIQSMMGVISEDQNTAKENLMNSIKEFGVLDSIKMMGGSFDNIVKILGEDSVDELIYLYLNENCYPDYNWGPELHDFYREEIEKYGSYDFLINDEPEYHYIKDAGLYISFRLRDKLDEVFKGYDWVPVFNKWFEENSGLKTK